MIVSFFSAQEDTSLHCQTIDTKLMHRAVFFLRPSLY